MSESEVLEAPALYQHCAEIYKRMASECTRDREAYDPDNKLPEHLIADSEAKGVWIGHITKLFAEEGFNIGSYTRVIHRMIDMNCVHQIQRGSMNSYSKWLVIGPPTIEAFNRAGSTGYQRVKREARQENSTDQRLEDLARGQADLRTRIKNLEQWQQATEA